MRFWKIFLNVMVLISAASSFNHPEIKWKSVNTEHFSINFYDKTEPAVYSTWKIAEETFTALAPLYDYKLRNKIQISLADYDDYSNGSADFTTSNIIIWVPDSRFEFRGNTTWLRNVLTHEITHLLSLESKKSMQLMDITAQIGFSTPDEQLTIAEPFPRMTFLPNWLAEGIAQRESERSGNDCWDSRREMLLRNAVLSNSLLSLDEMGYFNHDTRGNEMVYNQGLSFITFIENRIGYENLRSLFKAGSASKINLSSYFTEHMGKPLESFYAEWKDSLKEHYSVLQIPNKNPEKVLYSNGIFNMMPKISPDGSLWGWLSSGKDDAGETALIICSKGSTKVKYRLPHATTSWAFSKDSRKIYFIKARDPNENGSYFNDIFEFDINKQATRRLSRNARVYDIAVSPINNSIACVTYNAGAFSLEQFDPKNSTFKMINKGIIGQPFIASSWSPLDSTLLAVSRIVDGRSVIYICSTKDQSLKQVTSGKAQEESPYWNSDGRIFFSADYDGIFNVYSVKSDSSDLKRYSDVIGGCFYPTVSSQIYYSGYGKSGFTIAEIQDSGYSYEIPSFDRCTFKPLPEPKGKVTIKAAPYTSHLGRSLWEMQLLGNFTRNKSLITDQHTSGYDTSSIQVGAMIASSRSDALSKRSRMVGAVIGVFSESADKDSSKKDFRAGLEKSIQRDMPIRKMVDQKFNYYNKSKLQISSLKYHTEELNSMITRKASESDTAKDSSAPSIMPFLMPALSFVNSENAPTYGLEVTAQMGMMIIPVVVGVNAFSQWDLSRCFSAGLGTNWDVYPLNGLAVGNIPLTLQWSTTGVYNKDINYNYNNYSEIKFTGGPQFLPQQKVNSENDTIMIIPNGTFAELSLFHGFPLGKYASFHVFTDDRIDYYNREILDSTLDGSSRTYVQSSTGVKFVFPLVRDINSGYYYYFDAFYGSIGYALVGRANGEFFDRDNYSKKLLTDEHYCDKATVGHVIMANLTLGHYKSYQFFKELSLDVNYELLRKEFKISISAGLL